MSYIANEIDDTIVRLIQRGSVGFLPSDTIYGLTCRALNRLGVEQIYNLKGRDSDKPFIILIANYSQLSELNIEEQETEPARIYWPGALTLVCRSGAPDWLTRGTQSLAVRMPDNDGLRRLIETVGPIVSTSANTQSEAPAGSVVDARKYFGDLLDFYVDAGDLSHNLPSTLAKNNGGKLEILRQGSVKIEGNP